MDAAQLVRTTRKNAGLTQAELARRAGTTQPEIARLEAPAANPRIQTLSKVLAAAGSTLKLSVETPADIDPAAIAGTLGESPNDRLLRFEALNRFVNRYRGAARPGRD